MVPSYIESTIFVHFEPDTVSDAICNNFNIAATDRVEEACELSIGVATGSVHDETGTATKTGIGPVCRLQIIADCVNHTSRHYYPGGDDRYWWLEKGKYRLFDAANDKADVSVP